MRPPIFLLTLHLALLASTVIAKEACEEPSLVFSDVRVFDGHSIIPQATVIIRCTTISRVANSGEPQELPEIINSTPGIHWQVSVDEKGNIYFSARAAGTHAARIYYSEFRNGDYSQPRIVEGLENTDAHSPYIASDGTFLIISKSDGLNILFRSSDGSWTNEKKLVDRLGVAGECPAITPDGRYLFFIQTIPYWVDASFIEEWRQKE